jgi:hypothetical protein
VDWDALEWWEKLTYIDGMRKEGIIRSEGDAEDDEEAVSLSMLPTRSIEGKADWG